MTGSPLKRQCKLGVRAEDVSVMAFPRLTHPRARLSHARCRALGPGEKLERLFGMLLDDLCGIMSWPMDELDPFRLSVGMQMTRVVFTICIKAFLDGRLGREAARERNRERMLGELVKGSKAPDSLKRQHATYKPRSGRSAPGRGVRKLSDRLGNWAQFRELS